MLLAPEIQASAWLNTDKPRCLQELRGKVVVIHAFQMLCPGCVSHGIPQAQTIIDSFSPDQVQLIGLHTVFEHHEVMNIEALKAFVHEYRINFPIAVDEPADQGYIPKTMHALKLRGTPSLVIIDHQGNIRFNHFGRIGDLQLGGIIGGLVSAGNFAQITEPSKTENQGGLCDAEGCPI